MHVWRDALSIARYFNPRLRFRLLTGQEPPWLRRHPRRSYIRACVLAAVAWGDRREIEGLRSEARRLTEGGDRHVLDHVIPLNHPYVCGLHVGANLRVVPWHVNASKGNRWMPDQLELAL